MNATLINTAPLHGTESRDRLQPPVTPRRKLRIPSVFEEASTPGRISKSTNSPGKLKIPSAFSDLKTLKPLDDSLVYKKEVASGKKDVGIVSEKKEKLRSETKIIVLSEKQVSGPVPVDTNETSPEKEEPAEAQPPQEKDQLSEKNIEALSTRATADDADISTKVSCLLTSKTEEPSVDTPRSKPKRRVRKQRSKKISLKEQLLVEIAALEKEIEMASSIKSRIEVTSQLDKEPQATATEPSVERSRKVYDRKDSGADEELLILESESSDAALDEVFVGQGLDVGSTESPVKEVVISPSSGVDSRSIQSPRTKTKTQVKLRSFFKRMKSRKKAGSSMNLADALV